MRQFKDNIEGFIQGSNAAETLRNLGINPSRDYDPESINQLISEIRAKSSEVKVKADLEKALGFLIGDITDEITELLLKNSDIVEQIEIVLKGAKNRPVFEDYKHVAKAFIGVLIRVRLTSVKNNYINELLMFLRKNPWDAKEFILPESFIDEIIGYFIQDFTTEFEGIEYKGPKTHMIHSIRYSAKENNSVDLRHFLSYEKARQKIEIYDDEMGPINDLVLFFEFYAAMMNKEEPAMNLLEAADGFLKFLQASREYRETLRVNGDYRKFAVITQTVLKEYSASILPKQQKFFNKYGEANFSEIDLLQTLETLVYETIESLKKQDTQSLIYIAESFEVLAYLLKVKSNIINTNRSKNNQPLYLLSKNVSDLAERLATLIFPIES